MAKPSKWTKEEVIRIARQFNTIKDFRATHPSAAAHAYKHGYKDEAFSHIERKPLTIRSQLKIGHKYGRLTFKKDLGIIKARASSSSKRRHGLFSCDCGNPALQRIETSKVRNGKTKSCGECRLFENPHNYGETKSQCLICGAEIKTKLNRISQGRGKTCSRECMYEWRKLKALDMHIGFKHRDGQLTVIKFKSEAITEIDSHRRRALIAKCICDCGMNHYASWEDIRQGTCLRCTICEKKHLLEKSRPYHDLIGSRFGRLLIKNFKVPEKPGNTNGVFLCRCDCGTENYAVDSANLLTEDYVISCGCIENIKKDTYRGFKRSKEHRERACNVYLIETVEGADLEIGYTENIEKIADGKEIHSPRILRLERDLNRAKCWVVYNALLKKAKHKKGWQLKISAANQSSTRLKSHRWTKTSQDRNEFTFLFDQLIYEAKAAGWQALYERHVLIAKN